LRATFLSIFLQCRRSSLRGQVPDLCFDKASETSGISPGSALHILHPGFSSLSHRADAPKNGPYLPFPLPPSFLSAVFSSASGKRGQEPQSVQPRPLPSGSSVRSGFLRILSPEALPPDPAPGIPP